MRYKDLSTIVNARLQEGITIFEPKHVSESNVAQDAFTCSTNAMHAYPIPHGSLALFLPGHCNNAASSFVVAGALWQEGGWGRCGSSSSSVDDRSRWSCIGSIGYLFLGPVVEVTGYAATKCRAIHHMVKQEKAFILKYTPAFAENCADAVLLRAAGRRRCEFEYGNYRGDERLQACHVKRCIEGLFSRYIHHAINCDHSCNAYDATRLTLMSLSNTGSLFAPPSPWHTIHMWSSLVASETVPPAAAAAAILTFGVSDLI